MKHNYIHNSNKISEKLNWKYWKFFLLAILGGFFVGLGCIGYFSILGNSDKYGTGGFLAAAIFPVGLIFCVFFGGSLFTSDSTVFLKFFERKAKVQKLLLICLIVFVGNFIGALLCSLVSIWAGIYDNDGIRHALEKTARSKAGMNWYASIGSGLICNILVAGTIWMVNSVKRNTPKILIIWIVITFFVISGTQHIVANMYIFLTGWLTQVEFDSFGAIFENMLPTTLGNWISGAIIIPGVAFVINNWTLKEPLTD